MQTKRIAVALFALTLVFGVAAAFAAGPASSGTATKAESAKCDGCPQGAKSAAGAHCNLKDKAAGAKSCCADQAAKKTSAAGCDDCSCCEDCDPSDCSHAAKREGSASKPKA